MRKVLYNDAYKTQTIVKKKKKRIPVMVKTL